VGGRDEPHGAGVEPPELRVGDGADERNVGAGELSQLLLERPLTDANEPLGGSSAKALATASRFLYGRSRESRDESRLDAGDGLARAVRRGRLRRRHHLRLDP
jgi:hypothetical protein